MNVISALYNPSLNLSIEKEAIRVKAPNKMERLFIRLLIVVGVVSALLFVNWFFDRENAGYYPLFILLGISVSYKLLHLFFEWYHYWSIKVPQAPAPVVSKAWEVDMFTTAVPGEPFEMIKRTLIAMKNVRYPHNTYLCDEGNSHELRTLCESLDVIHVTRSEKINAKAGNINNALKFSTAEICVILDPDHEPFPEFLDHVLPHFNDPKVGFVQVVQAYGNSNENAIAKGAAQQTYAFYGPLMCGMNSFGTVQALGANCTFRRKALDTIGGHAPGLAEDMHTAMRLHAKGWGSVYVPQILSRGLVPSTLPAYYKQQLKWARGTFELLLTVYPLLFKNFSWRQKIHYFLLPLHFAAGLIGFLDIAVPTIALSTGYTPLKMEFDNFILLVIPLLVSVVLIRQYSQKWYLERHERGFHLTGGAILFGTWWVHLLGLLYTLLRVNVPYIPTPKDDKATNNWVLSFPNIMVCLISIGAIYYGLNYDWSPHSFYMASFALTNVLVLSFVIMAGQHQLVLDIKRKLNSIDPLSKLIGTYRSLTNLLSSQTYMLLRNGAPLLSLLVLGFCLSSFLLDDFPYKRTNTTEASLLKYSGGFYTGAYLPSVQDKNSLAPFEEFEQAIEGKLNIISIYQSWGPNISDEFPQELLDNIAKRGALPMITWEPYVSGFPERPDSPELRFEKKGMAAIAAGKFDDYIKEYALKIRAYSHPVFIRFGHEPDNPAYPWSEAGDNTPEEYVAAWRQIVSIFAAQGVSNVTWVWTPWQPTTFSQYYPGDQFIDWIGLTCLNYGLASDDGKWKNFEEIYTPFRSHVLETKKPVMLAEFGSTSYGGNNIQWLNNSLQAIESEYKEIRSIVFFNSKDDKNWITNWRPLPSAQTIDWTITQPKKMKESFHSMSHNSFSWAKSNIENESSFLGYPKDSKVRNNSIVGKPGDYRLMIANEPYYIKGVAYNAMHEWRDGHYPLTKRQLEKDFKAIKEMGANTIRRYHPSIYDKNILDAAQENNLKVIYGFWFDPEIDYYRDTVKVREYIHLVEQKVKENKTSPAILIWSVGNETSGLLKKKFDQPYLGIVRKAYIQMVELIAQRIHQLDPHRPVFTALEHSWQLPGELFDYNKLAPSIDAIGVNSYYDEQISELQTIVSQFDSTRPYIVSEFGPSGYWNPEYTSFDKNKALIEENDMEKAALYSKEWNDYIAANKGYNLGGVAFSWRDRYEGTVTWFGLTDFRGRKKPAFYALQNAWSEQQVKHPLPKVAIIGPSFKLLPGKEYNFKAYHSSLESFETEWKIYKDDYLQEVGKVDKTDDPNIVKITLPKNAKNCRLFLYMYDKKGNVTTASKPINVYQY